VTILPNTKIYPKTFEIFLIFKFRFENLTVIADFYQNFEFIYDLKPSIDFYSLLVYFLFCYCNIDIAIVVEICVVNLTY